MKFVSFFVIIQLIFVSVECANILALWPILSRTNFNVGLALLERLAVDNHAITLVSPYEPRGLHENIKNVKLEKVAMSVSVVSVFQMRNMSTIELMRHKVDFARDQVDFVLSDSNIKELMKKREKFDLVLIDSDMNDALLGFAYYFDAPVAIFGNEGVTSTINKMLRNSINSAYHPVPALGFSENMDFRERLVNSAMNFVDLFIYHFHYIPSQEALFREYFKEMVGGPLPKLVDLIQNVDLVLLNSHVITHPSQSHSPNSVEVGGLHIQELEDQIHPEFFNTLDRAVDGIIYLSFGSNIKSSELPIEKIEIFLKTFASMRDVLILWKFETNALKERHGHNIIIGPWLPQQEILKHKNLKVFITHGGLLSLMEAVNFGKPVIGIPFFKERKSNLLKAEQQGYGLILDYDSLSEDLLKTAISTVFNDESFQKNAERLSAIFKDNLVDPLDKAVFYINHLIRTGGADHLKSPATKLTLCQLYLIDQIIFVTIIILIAVLALAKVIKQLKMKFQKRKESHTIKSPKRNKFKSN